MPAYSTAPTSPSACRSCSGWCTSLPIDTRGYELSISETHHTDKKDAPSGTALSLQQTVRDAAPELDAAITSQREGDVAGIHSCRPARPTT